MGYTNSIVRHNYDNTRFMIGQKPSSIDHIYSNCPMNIHNTITHDFMIQDHKLLSFQYKTKSQRFQSKFLRTKNYKNLTRSNLSLCFEHCDINYAFQHCNSNSIANIIQNELCTIIETLAPTKYKQFYKKYTPYYNRDINSEIRRVDKNLTRAIKINNIDS